MSNIVSLPGITKPDAGFDAQPRQDVIDALEDLLREARAGRLQSLATAEVYDGDRTSLGWTIGPTGTHSLFAAIGDLQHEFAEIRRVSGKPDPAA